MSLSPTERMVIALCPDEVAVRHGGGAIEAAPVASRTDAQDWRGAVGALAGLLAETPVSQRFFGRRRQASLVLSDRFVRYALLPWSEAVRKAAQWQALAQACCETCYGDMSAWTFRIDSGDYGVPRLAGAVETKFLSALRSLMAARGIDCPQVLPYFAVCWNRWRQQVGDSEALFAVHDAGTTVIAMCRQGQWHSLRMHGGASDADALAMMLRREALLQGCADSVPCYAHVPGAAYRIGDACSLRMPDEFAIGVSGVAATMACVGTVG